MICDCCTDADGGWEDDSDFDVDSDDSVEDNSLCNTVLLTGPHGCGKTSSVYALSLQHGFKVGNIEHHRENNVHIMVMGNQLSVTINQLSGTINQLPVTINQLLVTINQLSVTINQLSVTINQLSITINQLSVAINQFLVTIGKH